VTEVTPKPEPAANRTPAEEAGANADSADTDEADVPPTGDTTSDKPLPSASATDPENAPLRQPQPTTNAALDPRTYTPTAQYAPGGGRFAYSMEKSRLATIADGHEHAHPACGNATPFNSRPPLSPTVDGSLAEWSKAQLAVIDRAGDGFSATASGGETAAFDLRELYYAEDDGHIYVAIKLEQDWSLLPFPGNSYPRLTVAFQNIVPPADDTVNTEISDGRSFDIFGDDIREYDFDLQRYDDRTAPNFEIAVSGSVIELRVAKSEIFAGGAVESDAFGVHVYLPRDHLGSKTDWMAMHQVGLEDDYACLVTMPDDSFKMFVMRHEDGVDPEVAEVVFRSMIAAAPAVEHAMGESYDHADTVALTVVQNMRMAGTYHFPIGNIFMVAGVYDENGNGHPKANFRVAAHEYAHGLNSADYQLPVPWMSEGHSEWAAIRAEGSYYGEGLLHDVLRREAQGFVTAAVSSDDASLEDWDESLEAYYKAASFYDLISGVLPYEALLSILRDIQTGAAAVAGSEDYLGLIAGHASFTGTVSASMWDGWFEGTYDASIFKTAALGDDDADGVLNHLEARYGLDAASADTDEDGMSDSFERFAGSDPKIPAPADERYFVADNLLGDWADLGALVAMPGAPASGCGAHHDLVKAGVVFDGDWLVVGIELAGAAAGQDGALVAFLDEPDSEDALQIKANYGDNAIFAFREGSPLETFRTASALSGTSFELAYHRSWLGWGKQYPEGLKVKVATYSMASGGTPCETLAPVPPAYP
jgi:hypothetical protein